VELVVSDDHEGLKSAIARHFQGASWQRCQVHYARNLLGMVSHARGKKLGADLRAIFAAAGRTQALAMASEIARKWRGKGYEKVAESTLRSTSRSASLAWLSPRATRGASALQTAWRG
jgi:putative transposase